MKKNKLVFKLIKKQFQIALPLLFLLCSTLNFVKAQNQFELLQWAGSGTTSGKIYTGFLNDDKYADVFWWNESVKYWTVNLSTGSGFKTVLWGHAYGTTGPVYTGDLNHDGKTDVFFWDESEKVWQVNLSTGYSFLKKPWSGAWGSDGPINVADLNGDGFDDVFMWRDRSKDWTINISTGTGFNTQIWHGAWGSDGQINVGDLNADGKADVFMWNNSMRNWSINLSRGNDFDAQAWIGAPGSEGRIYVGDLNGDKKTDVFLWKDPAGWQVNLSTGSGFTIQQWTGVGSSKFTKTGDFNGDGKTDIATWIESTKEWKINFSTGSGFNTESYTGVWNSDGPINVGDLNGDGKTDIFIWNDPDKSWKVNLSSFPKNTGTTNSNNFDNGIKETNKVVSVADRKYKRPIQSQETTQTDSTNLVSNDAPVKRKIKNRPDDQIETKPVIEKQITSVSNNTEVNPVNQQNPQLPLNSVSITNKSPEQRIADLEARVANLEFKTPYYAMDLITITLDENNLFESEKPLGIVPGTQKIYDLIKIDHPLINNNPNAQIFFNSPGTGILSEIKYAGGCELRYSEGYWYIKFSKLRTRRPERYKFDIYTRGDFSGADLKDCDWDYVYQYGGISVTQLVSLKPGDKFSFLIFIKNPTVEQTIRERLIKTN